VTCSISGGAEVLTGVRTPLKTVPHRAEAGEARPFSLAQRWLICRKTITARLSPASTLDQIAAWAQVQPGVLQLAHLLGSAVLRRPQSAVNQLPGRVGV
jgi:hypothetical protein